MRHDRNHKVGRPARRLDVQRDKPAEKKADFLYTSVEKYIRDAEKDNKPELIKMWNTIKEDEQNHLKMLREELVREVKENKLK